MSPPVAVASAVRRAQQAGTRWALPGTDLSVSQGIERLWAQLGKDAVPALAGNIAFRLMFAFFPTLISILWLLNVVNAGQLESQVSDLIGTVVPGVANGPLKDQIQHAPRPQASGAFTPAVGISLVVALWAIAEAFRATMHALNVVYGVKESRSNGRRLLLSICVSVVTMALFVVALVVILSGAQITAALSEWSGLGVSYQWLWWFSAWLVVVTAVLAAFSLTYYFAPDVEQRLRWVRTGSLGGVGLWLLFTACFALYVNVFSRPTETYGALAGVAFFMVYLYASSFILLIGAEFNQVIENWEPEGKSTGERAPDDA